MSDADRSATLSNSSGAASASASASPGSTSSDSHSPTSGSSDASTSKPPAPPKIASCAPCRIRRVRCDRVPGTDESVACIKCEKKGLQCTALPLKPKKTIMRSGPRLELAIALYGESGVSKFEAKAKAKGKTKALPEEMPVISSQTASAKLSQTELQGALISSLLDEFFSGSV
ncbi:Zn(2)-C7 fungal-type transcription factor [Pseudohyphozyma bogoriensis]|nr:Zn(2)-C7 fungal-type transcription factor [Pseudohyphozyma bogoriensis]